MLAKFCDRSPIGIGPDQYESRIAASREAEESDALRIDLCSERGLLEHEIDQALDVSRSLHKGG